MLGSSSGKSFVFREISNTFSQSAVAFIMALGKRIFNSFLTLTAFSAISLDTGICSRDFLNDVSRYLEFQLWFS